MSSVAPHAVQALMSASAERHVQAVQARSNIAAPGGCVLSLYNGAVFQIKGVVFRVVEHLASDER
jgi:hypothetical protein